MRTVQFRRDYTPSGILDTVILSMRLMKATLFRICVPICDALRSGLWEGVEEILSMNKGAHTRELLYLRMELIRGLVPVLIVFTKFDLLVSQENAQGHENPEVRARAMYEDLRRSRFHEDSKDVPAVIFSSNGSSLCVPRETI